MDLLILLRVLVFFAKMVLRGQRLRIEIRVKERAASQQVGGLHHRYERRAA